VKGSGCAKQDGYRDRRFMTVERNSGWVHEALRLEEREHVVRRKLELMRAPVSGGERLGKRRDGAGWAGLWTAL
jgi:hypothetical protein